MGRPIGYNGSSLSRLINKIKIRWTDCWEFQGKTNNSGYCSFWLYPERMLAHRASWIIHYGPIPENLNVCHSCDNKICVNPAHLFLGTDSENMKDAVSKERTKHPGQSGKTHCKRGHEFNEENTRVYKNGRWCKACHRESEFNRRHKKNG